MKKAGIAGMICLGVLLGGCSNNPNTLPESKNTQEASTNVSSTTKTDTSTSAGTKNSVDTTSGSSATGSTATIKISAEEAIQAFEKAYPNTAVTGLDLDTSYGTYYYEIKGVDDNTEYEVKIHAETGELTKEKEERLDRDEQNGVEKEKEALDLKNLLSVQEAGKIAEETVGNGEAVEWSLEKELNTTYWEVKVQNGRSETKVKLDAKSGKVLETELDD